MSIKSVALACALMCLAVTFETSSTVVKQKLFPIEGRNLESLVDAATQLRLILPAKLNAAQRCERYGIMLAKFQANHNSLGYFEMGEIGLMGQEKASAEFGKITFDRLRGLYIDGINSFKEANDVNAAMIEIYRCLETNFKRFDPVALKFLNDQRLKKGIDQYESVTRQPARLLVEGQHPELKLEQLQTGVAKRVANWLDGGERELLRVFPSVNQHQAEARAYAQVGQQHPNIVENAQQVQPVVNQPPQVPPVETVQWDEEEAQYLIDISNALVTTFKTLPDATPMSVACKAYNEVVKLSEQEGVLEDPGFVGEVVRRVFDEEKTKPENEKDETFVPEESERKKFLFVLQAIGLPPDAESAWLDFTYCAGQWVEFDDEAREFTYGEKSSEIPHTI